MGNSHTLMITDPEMYGITNVDENYVVNLIDILERIDFYHIYDDPIMEVVKNQLRMQSPIAMNFVMEIVKHSYNYNTYNICYVRKISNWHSHFITDWNAYFLPTEIIRRVKDRYPFTEYMQLLGSHFKSKILHASINEDAKEILPKCKCYLTTIQMEMYQYLVRNAETTTIDLS